MSLPCDEIGSGEAVVLLHAGVADRRMWREHLGPLAEAGVRAVAPDLPGFGDSPAPGLGTAWDEVLATMDDLGIERATLVGNSFGGDVAQRVAVAAPERVSALVLVSSSAPGVEPSAELEAVWSAEEQALEAGDTEAAVDAVVSSWTLPDASEELRRAVAEMQRHTFELRSESGEPDLDDDPLEDAPQLLEGVRAPVLLTIGEHDMRYFHDCAEALARMLPQARRETIGGAGHLAPLEQPEAFRALLLGLVG